MPIVKMPDGKNVRFPDDMPREQIKQFIVSKFPEEPKSTETSDFSLKPLTEEQKSQTKELAKGLRPKSDLAGDVWDVAKSSAKGLLSGTESYANGLSLGGYEWAGDKLGLGVSDRKEELRRQAEEAGVGGLNTASNVLAELGGGLRGVGKLTYNLAKQGVNQTGNALKYGKFLANSNVAPLALSGGIDSGINSAFRNDFSNSATIKDDMQTGALLASGLGVVGKTLVPLSKLFSANSITKGLRGGLHNVTEQPRALKILNSGIRQDDEVAQEFLNKAPAVARKINSESSKLVNGSLIHRIDVPTTVTKQKEKYGKFLNENGDMEVLNFNRDIPLARRYKLNNLDYQPVLKSIRRNMQRNDSGFAMGKTPDGKIDYPHFLKDQQRAEYITTLPGTYKSPQEIIPGAHNNKEREYLLKQYFNPESGEDVYDVAIRSGDGALINKITREGRTGKREFEKARQAHTSTSGTTSRTGQVEGTSIPAEQHVSNVQSKAKKVKNINMLYEGLTPFQGKSLQKAVEQGLSKTNRKPGSLESVNNIKHELNDMIVQSQNINPNNRLASIDGSDTIALREIKKRVDDVLGNALKGRDRGYKKAKELENAYNAGLRHNANNLNNMDLVPNLNQLNRQGFAQGVFRQISNNSLTNQNLASNALKHENTLADVLPKSKYDSLIENLNQQSTKFGRLSGLGRKAENKLQTPESNRLFAREQWETKGSILGSGIDWLNSTLRSHAIKKASQNLMNPDFVGLKDSWVLEKYPYLANYLSAITPQTKNN